jgi:co-chaperonin GroES (HSP10)
MAAIPIRNSILFAFVDDTAGGKFITKTRSGILTTNQDVMSQPGPRWAKALAVGPACTEVRNGDLILIESLMWTKGFEHDEVKIWKTDESKILAITDRIEDCYQL